MSASIDRWLVEHGLEILPATMSVNDIDLDVLQELSDSELAASLGALKEVVRDQPATLSTTLPRTWPD